MKENLDRLKIGGKFFNSRLMLGTGKYKTTDNAISSIESSDCEIVTVAIDVYQLILKMIVQVF